MNEWTLILSYHTSWKLPQLQFWGVSYMLFLSVWCFENKSIFLNFIIVGKEKGELINDLSHLYSFLLKFCTTKFNGFFFFLASPSQEDSVCVAVLFPPFGGSDWSKAPDLSQVKKRIEFPTPTPWMEIFQFWGTLNSSKKVANIMILCEEHSSQPYLSSV